MTAVDDDSELECRVCRGGPDLPSRPLFSPCLCSGSIGLVHQDCLEAWLKHSQKDNCELCKQKYSFDPEYAENVPDVLPIGVLLYSALKFLPYVFRVLMGPFLWLLYAPSCTNLVYKAWFRKDAYSKTFFSKDWHYTTYLEADTLAVMFKDSTTGLVLMGVIIISSVVLISFADFLRLDPLEIEERQAAVAVPAAPIRAFGPIRQQNAPPQRVLRRNRFAHPAFGVVRRGVERPVETKTDSDHGENTDERFADINEQDMEVLMKKLGVLPKSAVSHEDNAVGSSISGPGSESNVSNTRFPSDSDTSSQPRKEMRLSDYRTSRLLHGKSFEGNDQEQNSLDSVDDGTAKSLNTLRESKDMNSRRIIAGNSINTTEYVDLDESHDMHSPYGGSKTKERVMFSRQNKSASPSPSSSATRTSYSARRKDAVHKMEKHDNYVNTDHNSPNDDDLDYQQKYEAQRYEAAVAFFCGESPKGVKAPQQSGSSSKINNNDLDELKVAGTIDAAHVSPKVHTKHVRSGKGTIHFDEWSDAENENEDENENVHQGEGDPDEVEGDGDGEGDEVDAIVEELNGLINDHGDAEIEIHNALDEIFGVRPNHPWHVMFRTFIVVLTFNVFHLGFFFALPATIGSKVIDHLNAFIPFGAIGAALNGAGAGVTTSVVTTPFSMALPTPLDPFILLEQDSMTSKALRWLMNGVLLLLKTILPITGLRSVTNMVSDVIEKSRDSGSTLEVLDVCLLFVGYFSIFTSIFFIFWLSQAMEKIAGFSKFVSALTDVIRSLAQISKVFVLLYLRIFILPMCLGACVLSSSNVLLVIPREEWVTFIATNIVGSIALTWVLGITYMLTVTLFVLQLREVLHPGVLAQNIRPQEAHLDLLGSLILDTSVNHVRRMCVLMVVYMVLMALLVVAPIWLVRFTSRLLNITHYLTLRTWYVLPEVQLPFELAFGHIAFLTVLDRYKNAIGRMQHYWLVFACDKLGLTRYLLPSLTKKVSHNTVSLEPNEFLFEDPSGTYLMIGKPLKRPPIGWDARNPRDTTRWAWGREEISQLEKNLAPRVIPTYCLARVLVLCCLSWLLLILNTITITLVPVMMGRMFFSLAQFPLKVQHDPVAYIVGACVCLTIVTLTRSMALFCLNAQKFKGLRKSLFSIPLQAVIKIVRLLAAGCVSTLFVGLVQFFLLAESCPDKSPCLLVKLHDPYEWMRIYLIGVSTMGLLGGILVLLCLGDDVKHALLWLTGGRANEVGRWGRRGRRRIPRGRDVPIGGVGINGALNAAHVAGANQVPLHPIVNAPDPVAGAVAGAGAGGRPVVRPAVEVPVTELTRRMKSMQAALQDFIAEAATGQWNADQIGRLDTLWETLVWPLFRDLVLYTTLLNIGCAATLLCVHHRFPPTEFMSPDISQIKLMEISCRVLSCITFINWVLLYDGYNFKSFVSRIFKQIRDDYYLVGRKLQNRTDATVPPPVPLDPLPGTG